MKALVIESTKNLKINDVEKPSAEPGYVVIKVKYAGICGSDVHSWEDPANFLPVPDVIPGHEFVGTIEDASDSTFSVGERVTAIEYTPCNQCNYCDEGKENLCAAMFSESFGLVKNGAFAEYIKVRSDMVRKLPDSITDKSAAMIEPVAVAMHSLTVSGVNGNSKILITGAGAIGLMAAACAKAIGVPYVATTARNPLRLDFARKSTFVDRVFDGRDTDLKDTLMQEAGGFTHVIECSGSNALFDLAASVIVPGGTVVMVGAPSGAIMDYPAISLFMKEGRVQGSYFFLPSDFDLVIELMAKGVLDVEKLATSIISFKEAQGFLEEQTSGTIAEIKVLLDPIA